MKETIGLTKIELSKENISMNVEKEMELSLTDTENGWKMMCSTMDGF